MIIKICISLIFILFSCFQYNDPDIYIWMPLYFLTAVLVFLRDNLLQYIIILLMSISSIIFVINLNMIFTTAMNKELFYELGGIVLILSMCSLKLTKTI